jgi:predicted outer membrane repeat protein
MCSESRIHKIIQVSWFRHNGTWFHSSTNFRANTSEKAGGRIYCTVLAVYVLWYRGDF